jgi:hypothetical protein
MRQGAWSPHVTNIRLFFTWWYLNQGYDPIFIAATLGLDTLGIDISPTAIRSAYACASILRYLTSFFDDLSGSLLQSSPDIYPGSVTFQVSDFFSLSVTQDRSFDLVYDYT